MSFDQSFYVKNNKSKDRELAYFRNDYELSNMMGLFFPDVYEYCPMSLRITEAVLKTLRCRKVIDKRSINIFKGIESLLIRGRTVYYSGE